MASHTPPLPRRWWLWPLLVGIAARLISIAGIFYGQRASSVPDLSSYPLLHDATIYVGIAVNGYEGIPPGAPAGNLYDIAFLPLWPLLLRVASLPFGADPVAIGYVGALLASLFSLAGVIVIYRLFWQRYGPAAAPGAYLIALAPPAYAGALAYGDALALLLVATWWLPSLEARSWTRAGIGIALGLLRLQAAALALEALTARGQSLARRLLPSAGVALGLILYAAIVALVTGEPLGVLKGTVSVTTDYGGKGIIPYLVGNAGLFTFGERFYPGLIAGFGVLIAIAGLIALLRQGYRAEALVCAAIVALAVLGGSWPSWWRYLTFALPIYAALGVRLGAWIRPLLVVLAGMLFLIAGYGGATDLHP